MGNIRVASAGASLIAALAFAPAAHAQCAPPTVDWSDFPSDSQCVGGVLGWVRNHYPGHSFPNAWSKPSRDGCNYEGACMEWVAQLPIVQQPGVWNAHPWGTVPVQTYDIVVFTASSGSPYGHIAVVDSVRNGVLYIMDDNWEDKHEKSCIWGGHASGWPHATSWRPYGFFRRVVDEPRPCDCGAAEIETQACGTCGSQTRSCDGCSWKGWSACTPADYAAAVVDVSAPQALAAGASTTIWADFKNVGAKPWSADGVWLTALGSPVGNVSALFTSAEGWPAWNVPTVLAADVQPGDVGRFSFAVTAPATPGATIEETFQLQVSDGNLIGCSDTEIKVSMLVLPGADGAGAAGGSSGVGGAGTGGAPTASSATGSGSASGAHGGCSSASGTSSGGRWGAGLALALALAARKRRSRDAKS